MVIVNLVEVVLLVLVKELLNVEEEFEELHHDILGVVLVFLLKDLFGNVGLEDLVRMPYSS